MKKREAIAISVMILFVLVWGLIHVSQNNLTLLGEKLENGIDKGLEWFLNENEFIQNFCDSFEQKWSQVEAQREQGQIALKPYETFIYVFGNWDQEKIGFLVVTSYKEAGKLHHLKLSKEWSTLPSIIEKSETLDEIIDIMIAVILSKIAIELRDNIQI